MTSQRNLNRQVAAATGETVSEITRRGFGLLSPLPVEPELESLIIDWDQYDLVRNVAIVEQPLREGEHPYALKA